MDKSIIQPLSNPNANENAKRLYSYLKDCYGEKIITSQQESVWRGYTEMEIDFIEEHTGKLPAMRGLDFIDDAYLPVVKRAKQWHDMGVIVTICWHTGINGKGYRESQEDIPDFEKLFTDGSEEQNAMLAVWDKAADALRRLQEQGVPVLWRPFHEFDGGWFWWGKGGPEAFIRLWRMMYDRFTNKFGLNNLIWALGYSGQVKEGWYVGDEYCDIVGSDAYDGSTNRIGWERLMKITGGKKILAFHECGNLPEIESFDRDGCLWSWFMIWHTKYLTENNKDVLKEVYNSDIAITLDKLPKGEVKVKEQRIFVNQAGYFINDLKKAVLNFEAEEFIVENVAHDPIFKGKCTHFGCDRLSGDDVYIADFSSLLGEGKYRVRVGNVYSDTFMISDSSCDKLYHDIMKAYYYLRCGMKLEEKHAGKFTHEACHLGIASEWFDRSVKKDVSGGWHDAGDYGRYVTPGAVAVAHLLYSYILYPKAAGSLYLNIPETANSIYPDFLAECKYELDWLLKMQKDDGSVYHKATTAHHAGFVMPERDRAEMFLLPVSTMATADFAAITALASRVYKEFDQEYADKLLEASKLSAKWLEENPEFIGFDNPDGCGTGVYGEGGDGDNRFWAFAELYCTTGDSHYHDLMTSFMVYDFSRTELGVGAVGGLGALAYLTAGGVSKNERFVKAFKEMYLNQARRLRWMTTRNGYSCAMDERSFGWGSNMGLMKNAMIFAIADTVCGEHSYRDAAKAQLDILMGVNPLGVSYVTGNGEHAYNDPHLRPAFADRIEECIPGMVAGGPNSHPVERAAKRLIPEGTPPMRCYVDNMDFYSINEITIYWNSPAAFVLAYLTDI